MAEKAKGTSDDLTKNTLSKISKYEAKIQAFKKSAAVTTDTTAAFWSGLKKKIKEQYDNIESVWSEYSIVKIPRTYKQEVRGQIKNITSHKSFKKKLAPYTTQLKKRIHMDAVRILTEDSIVVMSTSLLEGEKMTLSLLRATQQQVLKEVKINELLAEGLEEAQTIQEAKNRILEALRKELLEPYVIKAGSKRFTAEYYAELLARTKIREAQTEAVINTAIDNGSDLVQVSSHNTTTPICIPFEGKVFSISGTSKQFPPLFDEPPFHPNCLHSLTVIFEEWLQMQGIEKWSDFSLGKTEVHPTVRSWVPISERSVNMKKVDEQIKLFRINTRS